MKKSTAEQRTRNIIWVEPFPATECEHHYEVIDQEEDTAIRRCTKCGHMEVE